MSTPVASAPPSSWDEPEGLDPRGTVVLLTGRGETAAAHGRFGRRISADSWRVRVVVAEAGDLRVTSDRLRALLTDPSVARPIVLAGTDTGALAAQRLALTGAVDVDAVLLAGLALPGAPGPSSAGWDDELRVRSGCDTHQDALAGDPAFEEGLLSGAVPAALGTEPLAPLALPTLVIHGEADPVSAVAEAIRPFAGAPGTEVVTIDGGLHDILSDLSHRTVAATVVEFLERLRLDPEHAAPIATRRAAPLPAGGATPDWRRPLVLQTVEARTTDTPQTPGMRRFAAISGTLTGSRGLWLGGNTVAPGESSGAHHHGEADSGIYVVSGHPRLWFLQDGVETSVEAGPGDFIFVPAWVPHREENASATEDAVVVLARSTPEEIVVNLTDLHDLSGIPGAAGTDGPDARGPR